jgi:hypothetical protein
MTRGSATSAARPDHPCHHPKDFLEEEKWPTNAISSYPAWSDGFVPTPPTFRPPRSPPYPGHGVAAPGHGAG